MRTSTTRVVSGRGCRCARRRPVRVIPDHPERERPASGASASVAIDADDIGGAVTGPKGPERASG